jgi:DNA-directed RNA polymerase subunit RPC12/RpoP
MSKHDNPDTKYACPECGHQLLTIVAPAEFDFDGDDQTTGPGIGVEWDDDTQATCRYCGHTDFTLAEAAFGGETGRTKPQGGA